MPSSTRVSCLCGQTDQVVKLETRNGAVLALCHCDTCRHSSGVLCTSYYPLSEHPSLTGTSEHSSADGFIRHFCSVCGCHMFRWRAETGWEATIGVIQGTVGDEDGQAVMYQMHEGVKDTKDGGISIWIRYMDGQQLERDSESPAVTASDDEEEEVLPASCACGTVTFGITRPNEASSKPSSNFPDLMFAYSTADKAQISNASDEKWWLREGSTKYLAGTCTCRSCRLASGFDIQTWAFVPRTNIVVHSSQDRGIPLEFPARMLQGYASSPGVVREFCGTCGATVFWHDQYRSDVVDVSVGLLRAREGARAERWLDWWRERVSFAEDAGVGRRGAAARRAKALAESLGDGLKKS